MRGRSVSCDPIIRLHFVNKIKKMEEERKILRKKEKIEKKMNKDGLYQHHCSLELRFREERKKEERDQIRLSVCSEICLSKSPCVF